jgi:Mrp family chromosome partitioning ATPase
MRSKEAANYLGANLDQQLPEVSPKIITVTSAEKGAGKSSLALALARAYARTGRSVLSVDADLGRPVLDGELGVYLEEKGLVSLRRDSSLPIEPHSIQPFLDFLPAGGTAEDASERLSEHWRAFLARVLELGRYEVVVIDSAPVLPVADTLVIVPHVSGVLLVAAEGKTPGRHLIAGQELLKRVGAKVLGLAVTHVREGVWFLSGYRGYGYGHGGRKDGAAPALDRRPPA